MVHSFLLSLFVIKRASGVGACWPAKQDSQYTAYEKAGAALPGGDISKCDSRRFIRLGLLLGQDLGMKGRRNGARALRLRPPLASSDRNKLTEWWIEEGWSVVVVGE